MPLMPAMLASFIQLVTLVVCLPTVASVFLHCLVEFMLCVSDSALTFVEVFCLQAETASNRCPSKAIPWMLRIS
jgi:hypothetical protein